MYCNISCIECCCCLVTKSCPTLLLHCKQTTARQALLSIGFPRQEYWSGLPFTPSMDLPNQGIKLISPALEGGFFTNETSGKPILKVHRYKLKTHLEHNF